MAKAMASSKYLQLSVRASAITGGIFGLFVSLLMYVGGAGYGMGMGYGMMYGGGPLFIVTQTLLWALLSAAGAWVYNWALKK